MREDFIVLFSKDGRVSGEMNLSYVSMILPSTDDDGDNCFKIVMMVSGGTESFKSYRASLGGIDFDFTRKSKCGISKVLKLAKSEDISK